LEGGPPSFPRDFSCPAVLKLAPARRLPFVYGALTRSGPGFHRVRLGTDRPRGHSVECPGVASNPVAATATALTRPRFGLIPVRSPLLGESRLISVPRGTKMFQFPRFPRIRYGFTDPCGGMTPRALPHSGIPGSSPADGSPRLFAAYHALHRLLAPRHPPYALCSAASAPARTLHTPALRLFLASMQLFRSRIPPHHRAIARWRSRRPPRELDPSSCRAG
jgi:hypothetical protein